MSKGNDEYKDNKRFSGSKSGGKEQAFEASSKAKTFGVKIPLTMACTEDKKGKRKISRGMDIIMVCVLVNEVRILGAYSAKGHQASVPIFEGPSVQGLLDHYGYNDIEEYLSWNYFPSTDKENTDKDITDKDIIDEDCIHESNYVMSKGKYVPVSQKHNPNVKSHVPVTGCVLGLANVTTCNEIVNKMGVRKSEICADKAKGKREVL
ncbi:hypothetical protein Tco_0822588, partial [Tanacetum coccineum]